LFNNQNGENNGAFSAANLKKFAQAIGLDSGAFNSCLDSGKYLADVEKDSSEGESFGVLGTPTFFIGKGKIDIDVDYVKAQMASQKSVITLSNGAVVIVGSVPFSTFDSILKQMLR
jgi:protein-disulfide isomerase